jgi:hypothetical protein
MIRLPLWCALIVLPALAGCHALRGESPDRATAASAAATSPEGVFDNHEQVWQAGVDHAAAPPHVVARITALPAGGWTLWQVHLDGASPLDASWAMQRRVAADGAVSLVPYRALVAKPGTGEDFDSAEWTALDACSLRETVTAQGSTAAADAAACATIAPGIGTRAALLPLAIEREGEWLHLRLYADQARGVDAREDLRRARFFSGWAAINGAGPKAGADSRDWHMNRELRLSSEGGQAALKWRDGVASGYSIRLERLTYRASHTPVLKLSVIEDASGQVLTYAWANPEATRIGLNLGWLQIGLDEQGAVPEPPAP